MKNHNRNRNSAIVLIAAGLFLLLGKMVGFFTLSALCIILLGVYTIRNTGEKLGFVLLFIGSLMFLSNHIFFILAIILFSFGYFYLRSKKVQRGDAFVQKQHLLESIRWDSSPWILKNTSIWCLIGEIRMDMSIAIIEEEEIVVILQGVIGDIDIIVPEELGLSIEASMLFGQVEIGKEKETGVMNKIVWQSPNYADSPHKLKLLVSYIVGDIDIKIL